MKKYKVLFCDLDGTLIETISGKAFPQGVWDMKLKFDVLDAIKNFSPYYIFIVTNQGGIEKGFVNEEYLIHKLDYISSSIKEYCSHNVNNYSIVSFEYCPYNGNHPDRKPSCGMLEFLFNCYQTKEINSNSELQFNKEDCLMIGDASGLPGQWSNIDKKTAENFGIDYMDVNEFIKNYK